MQLNRSRNIAEAMASEAPGPSGQRIQQESPSVVSNDGISVGRNVNNISLQTGEEFSREFLQDHFLPRKLSAVPDMAQNHENKVALNNKLGYEELTRILGLKRMDSDVTEFPSATGSTAESENGAFMSQTCENPKEDGNCGSGPTKAANEMNCEIYNKSASGSIVLPVIVSESSQNHQVYGLGVSDGSQSGKMKFLCSFGGKILPRPGDGKLRYVGGETRIISIRQNISWEELVKKTSEICNQHHNVKYQLPGEDLDALISVSSDEDLQNMIEEYRGLEMLGASQRLRIFLIPSTESENTCTVDGNTNQQSNPDYQYVVAVNGIVDPSPHTNYNGQSFARPMVKGRAFNSEKPISNPNNPTGLLLELDDSTVSHRGMPHAFSDSQLQEHGGRSTYCSQEGMSPSPPLNLAKEQLPSLVVSSVLQEKPVQLRGSIEFVNPQLQVKLLNVEPKPSHRTKDLLNCSFGSDSFSRAEYTCKDANGTGEKYHMAKGDASTYNFMIQNHNEKNPFTNDMMNGFDEDPHSHQGGKLCESRSPATAVEYTNKSPNISHDRISIPCVNTPTQELQVSRGMVPASSMIDLKPFADTMMQQNENQKLEDVPIELIVKGQRTVKVQQSRDENSSTDLLCGLSNDIVSHESSVLLPVACQKDMVLQETMLKSFDDLYPSAVSNDAGLKTDLNGKDLNLQEPMLISTFPSAECCDNPGEISTLLQNQTKDAGLRRDVSLLDDDFVSYPDQKAGKPDLGGCSSEKRKLEEFPVNKYSEQNHLKSVVDAEDVVDSINHGIKSSFAAVPHMIDATVSGIMSPSATEAEGGVFPESDFEDAKADYGDKDEPFSDAMIAEMEADIYGLQIIKNADIEELRELGSGTYGTVYHGKWRGTDVAIKRIKKSCFAGRSSEQERLTRDFWREAQILSNLHHPNVLAFYGVVPDGAGGTLATVTEFMVNGSLGHVLLKKDRSLDCRRKLIIAMDAAFGMEYLHSKNIVHFDLKCDNLLVNLRDPQRPICKVGDFGLSRIKRNTLISGGVRGTLPWMAPELLNGNSVRVSEKVDVFSFGIAMWEILTGEEPYTDMHCGAIIGGILKNTLRPTIPERCDPEWRKLMEECWSADPEARPSFTEIANRLRSISAVLQSKGHNNLAGKLKPKETV
ncbi:uncharacterized protein LOC132269113 [Cornus florida]|uniref:uncharacterized protein LOC132269113 n=1 Tax=Cornus florida TaxID=4283 RepID=UPI00289A013A|nr:uncharacterized protein LOC132269113 [Cornus florida]